jgi:hypothetical protein
MGYLGISQTDFLTTAISGTMNRKFYSQGAVSRISRLVVAFHNVLTFDNISSKHAAAIFRADSNKDENENVLPPKLVYFAPDHMTSHNVRLQSQY